MTPLMMTHPSIFAMPYASSQGAATRCQVANRDLPHEGRFEQCEIDGLSTALPTRDFFDEIVEISPIDSVKRHSTGRYWIVAESIYAPTRSRIHVHYNAPVHLLVLYEDGARREGESSVDGLPASRLKNFARKLTFVPAGRRYREWHHISAASRVTYLYLDPVKLRKSARVDAVYTPKVFFEDSTLWATAIKLKSVLESNHSGTAYLEALLNVLAHELARSGQELTQALSANRGGLASWQMRTVSDYIEQHLNEKVSLEKLASLARLSKHHFCRAFKQSSGISPYGYHLRRRTQQAQLLLSDRTTSITDVAFELGYSCSSSFSVTFRKITGQTPSQFRRNLKWGERRE
jgi:AraC family transcriptional regulator